jgi:hypothetical protein
MVSGTGPDRSVSTSHKSYRLLDVKNLVNKVRTAEVSKGLPHRKLSPVSSYLLDELIDKYFKEHGNDTVVLEEIVIKDTKQYGI